MTVRTSSVLNRVPMSCLCWLQSWLLSFVSSFPFSRCMQRAAGRGARFSPLFPSLRVKSFQLFLPFPLQRRLYACRLARTEVPSQWAMGPPCSSVSRCGNRGHKPLNCYLGSKKSQCLEVKKWLWGNNLNTGFSPVYLISGLMGLIFGWP